MNESQRKFLTGYIGECWHTLTAFLDNGIIECSCGARMSRGPDEATFHVEQENNRTFTTWADLGAVKEAIERKGEWKAFIEWIPEHWWRQQEEEGRAEWSAWLINPSRLPELVCQWKGVA